MIVEDTIALETERLFLRPVQESDLPALFAVHCDPELNRYLPFEPWRKLRDGEEWYAKVTGRRAEGSAIQLALVHKVDNRAIGSALLFNFEAEVHAAELGYLLGRDYWRSGLMREALQPLIRHCFVQRAFKRLVAKVEAPNIASRELLLSLGFQQEGILREAVLSEGSAGDLVLYGLLRREFKPQAAHQGSDQSAGISSHSERNSKA